MIDGRVKNQNNFIIWNSKQNQQDDILTIRIYIYIFKKAITQENGNNNCYFERPRGLSWL